ncbi:AI-2E family transporter [Homoserinimonas sp. OAct 916]|uniref:AI-2E family transporter n=1 Tax=Homoserinimonas sp. OAct 916 TaxID=2211450 RepID=UPI000DBE91D4|nr:AI-2E family transporter [Homoserinimonas sp. OAct 916]
MRFRKRTRGLDEVTVTTESAETRTTHAAGPTVRVNAFRIGLIGGLGVLVALLIGGVISLLSTVLIYIGVALFIALGLDPLVSWLERRMPRGLAIGVVFAAVIAIFAGLLFAVIPVIVRETTHFINGFPDMVDAIAKSDFVTGLDQQLQGAFDVNQAIQSGANFLQDPNNLLAIGGGILSVGAGVASGVTGAVIVLILTLYFLASLRSMKRTSYRFVPAAQRPGFIAVSEEITQAIGRYVIGQVSLALVNGILSFIFLTIIGAPAPALLAVAAFLLSIIPLIGTLTGSIIIVLVCLIASPLTALVAAIYYLIYMQVEAYVLSPRIMNKAVAVPGAIVVIAAVGGGAVGGVLGALVAIPIAASFIIIVQKIVFPAQDAKV